MNITATWHLVLALGTIILASVSCTEAATVPVIANLRMNLSADTVDPNDSSQVRSSGGNLYLANWVDQSGNGCNALQGASNAQPIYVANALNGKPVIRFNGSSDYLSTSLPQIARDKTLFVVQLRTNSTIGTAISSTASTGHFLGNSTSTNETKGRLGVAHDLSLPSSLNTLAIKTFIRAGGTETLRLNGATPVSSTAIPDVANGNYTISSSNYPFGGDIAEVIIYDRALSESERLAVEAYLEQKWTPTVIISATSVTGTVGGAFSYQIAATNGPTSYGATGLPAGLSVNPATGAITGTPAVGGTYSITLAATNAAGTGTATLTLTVSGASPPVITSATTATWTVASPFTYQITATNDPTSYDATGLPAGLSANTTTGAITGTPAVVGTYSITLAATNVTGTSNATLRLTVSTVPTVPVIANLRMNLSADMVNLSDSSQVRPSGGNLYLANWVDQSGNGCNALQGASNAQPLYVANALNGKPVIRFNGSSSYLSTSLPQIAGDKTLFVVQLRTNSTIGTAISSTASTGHFLGNSTSNNETKGRLGVAHDLSLAGSLSTVAIKTFIRAGGTETLRLSAATPVSSTSIPDVANGNYTISSSNYPFGGDIAEVIIYDRAISESERLAVEAYLQQKWTAPVITSATAVTGTVGSAFSYQITASGAPMSFNATSLPSGLIFSNSTGLMSGTPTQTGTFSSSISAISSGGTGSATLMIAIETPFDAWKRRNFTATELLDTSISGDAACPFGDGISNLMKYALNLNSRAYDRAGLPIATLLDTGNGTCLTLSYTRLLSASDITYTVEVSGDVRTWNSGAGYTAPVSVMNSPGEVTQSVAVQDLIPSSNGQQRFIRLRVTRP